MEPQNDSFNWNTFTFFTLPYALIMAIFNPHWGFFSIMSSALIFGFIVTLFLSPSPAQKQSDDASSSSDGTQTPRLVEQKAQTQEYVYIGMNGAKRDITLILNYIGIILFSIMGTLSLFIEQFVPTEQLEGFYKWFHVAFFFGMNIIFLHSIKRTKSFGKIADKKFEIFEKNFLIGHTHIKSGYQNIKDVEILNIHCLSITFLNDEKIKFILPLGLDLAGTLGQENPHSVDEELIYSSAKTIKDFLLQKARQAKIELYQKNMPEAQQSEDEREAA